MDVQSASWRLRPLALSLFERATSSTALEEVMSNVRGLPMKAGPP